MTNINLKKKKLQKDMVIANSQEKEILIHYNHNLF